MKQKRPPPPPELQTKLRAELTELRPELVARAAVLCRGLARLERSVPDPHELVNEASRRLLARYTDAEITISVGALAYTTLARIVCDIARRSTKYDGKMLGDTADVVPDGAKHEVEPFVRRALDRLEAREREVVLRVAVEGVAVAKAFELAGWAVRSPHAELRKIYDKLRDALREAA